jgi:integral membrane protein
MTNLSTVRGVGVVEAISAISLFFVAMPLKYFADMPKAVTIVGGIHGLLWVLYAAVVLAAWGKGKLTVGWVAILFVASLIPFGPFLVDGRLKKMEGRPNTS